MSDAGGDVIHIRPGVAIARSELDYRYVTSGGPGGQHANRNRTKVEITFDIGASLSLSPAQQRRAIDQLGNDVTVSAHDSRSQFRNKAIAERRLVEILADALRPPRPRTPTKPTKGSRRRRLENKRQRGELKASRRRPGRDE